MYHQNIDHKLINFWVPKYLITNFDNYVKYKRMSRTSVLIHLMENYMRTEKQQMEKDGELNEMIQSISENNRMDLRGLLKKDLHQLTEDEYEPPMIPYTSDNNVVEDWEERLRGF